MKTLTGIERGVQELRQERSKFVVASVVKTRDHRSQFERVDMFGMGYFSNPLTDSIWLAMYSNRAGLIMASMAVGHAEILTSADNVVNVGTQSYWETEPHVLTDFPER